MPVNQVRRWLSIAVPTVLFVLVFVALAFATNMGPSIATADAPQPEAVPFTGTPFTVTLDLPAEAWGQSAADVLGVLGETTTYTETFEAGLPPVPPSGPRWVTFDTSYATIPQNYKWGETTYSNGTTITGTHSLWAIGDGAIGSTLDPISDTYPAGVDSWIVYGPFDLSGEQSVDLAFDFWFDGVAQSTASFKVGYSTDGTTFTGQAQDLYASLGWVRQSYLGISDALGEPEVWVAFNFNAPDAENGRGVFIDNFVLTTEAPDPTPTPTATSTKIPSTDLYLPAIYKPFPPTPTPTPMPQAENYYTDFSTADSSWTTIRRRNTDGNLDNEIIFVDGALQAQAKSRGDYFILSPLKQAIDAPYEIQFDAEIMNESEKSGFLIVFGGDYDGNPDNCPSADYRDCFSEYYQLQVRYRNGDKTEAKVSYVNSHDSDNQPVEQTLWGWAIFEKEELDGDSLNKWEIKVAENGAIRIEANDEELVFLDGPRTIDNRYFGAGVFSDTEDGTDARVKFYDFCVGTSDFCRNPTNGGGGGGGGGGTAVYEQDFTTQAQVDEWEDAKHRIGVETDNKINFIPLSTDPRGLMQLQINKGGQFFIASPMVQGPTPGDNGYTIETKWGFAGSAFEDKLGMAMVFAGNANDPEDCLNSQIDNCFEQFYAIRVRYRSGEGNPHYEVKFGEANGTNGRAPIYNVPASGPKDWVDVSKDFPATQDHVWRISYSPDGTLVVYIDGTEVWRGQDTTYRNNRYFGFLLDTDVDVAFTEQETINVDYFRIYENE